MFEHLRDSQNKKAKQIVLHDYHNQPLTACFLSIIDKEDLLSGGALVYLLKDQRIKSLYIHKKIPAPYPYIPGGLSLRYKSLLIDILRHVDQPFDLVIVYPGAGIQHPRFCGLASEIGLEMNMSTIGITKEALVGFIDYHSKSEIQENVYRYNVLYKGRIVAIFLRVQVNVNGIFVSPGHFISIQSAGLIIAEHLVHRLPSPIRLLRQLIQEKI